MILRTQGRLSRVRNSLGKRSRMLIRKTESALLETLEETLRVEWRKMKTSENIERLVRRLHSTWESQVLETIK